MTGQHEADPEAGPAEQPTGAKPSAEQPTAEQPAAEQPAAEQPAGRGRRLNRGATALIGVLLAALGFGLAVQLQSNSKNDSLANAREEDLVRILDDQNSRIQRLQSQLTDLQAAKQRLSDSRSGNAA